MVDESIFVGDSKPGAEMAESMAQSTLLNAVPALSLAPLVFGTACANGGVGGLCRGEDNDTCSGEADVIAECDESIINTKVEEVCAQPAVMMPSEMPGVPLDDGVELLSPELIQGLVRDGTCLLIDVRSADRAAGTIEGSVHVPAISMKDPFVSKLPGLVQQYSNVRLIVFLCQSASTGHLFVRTFSAR